MKNNLTTEERNTLNFMKKDNFRNISKEDVLKLRSIIDKLDPEVAKALIAQMPEAMKSMLEINEAVTDIAEKEISSADRGTQSCFKTEDDLISFFQREAEKDNVPFEEKMTYYGMMEDAAKRKEEKDTEHKVFLECIATKCRDVCVVAVCAIAAFFIGGNLGDKHDKAA